MRIILTGKNAGKTLVLNGHRFINGVLTLPGDASANAGAVKYLGLCYGAHPEGSAALKAAQELRNGIQRNATAPAQSGDSNGLQSDRVQSAGTIPASSANDGGSTDAGLPADGAARVLPNGSGHEDAGLLPDQVKKIKDALYQLDPANPDHWTEAGLPSVEIVAQAMNDPSINRKAIETVMPEFNREIAQANSEL